MFLLLLLCSASHLLQPALPLSLGQGHLLHLPRDLGASQWAYTLHYLDREKPQDDRDYPYEDWEEPYHNRERDFQEREQHYQDKLQNTNHRDHRDQLYPDREH